MKRVLYYFTFALLVLNFILDNPASQLYAIQKVVNKTVFKSTIGDSVIVTHSQGTADGNVYVVVDDPSQLTGDDYLVFFDQQMYYRNENGEWIPGYPGQPNGPDTLTGSSISMLATYGPVAGSLEITCLLDLVSPDYNWADGITMTFPVGTTIIEAEPFEAGGGTVVPEIVGNTVNMGIVNGSQTGNGIFHGGEEWTLSIMPYQLPLTVDWIIYDDGYSGGVVNAEGFTVIDSVGYAKKIEDHWNLFNLTTQDTVLEDQTVIMGYDLYTGEFVGDPIVDGFKISVDVGYDYPTTMMSVKVNGTELDYSEANVWWFDDNYIVCDFTRFGYENGFASTTLLVYGGVGGTNDINVLQQDYEFRWTGVVEDTMINGNLISITTSGGSMITLFGASYYSLADHPLNPNPGVQQRFTVRVPFEIWNVDNNQQVNALFWDRSGDPTTNGGAVWNQNNREYLWIVNTPYSTDVIDETSQMVAENATWNEVFYLSTFTINDVVSIRYFNPIQFGIDLFTFTVEPASVDNEILPTTFKVFQNYPNPFNPVTTISYQIPERSFITIKVFDVLGNEVTTLANEEKLAGSYKIDWDASGYPSGVYFYELKAENFKETKKMILMK